ncbi:hypothetical protein Tco_0819355 [Tanacetum coccineum]|uniref:Uncharacterized protein n=1 Tax=Tanacetum coccineum TaxID=301880 RepID=A0ABQ5AAN7_9ASTR
MKMGCSIKRESNGKLFLSVCKLKALTNPSNIRIEKEESPCLMAKASQIQEHDSHRAESSSSVSLTTAPKMVINSPCLNGKKELAILEQKESTNPLMAHSFPKSIMPTKLVKPQGFNLRPNMGIQIRVLHQRLKKSQKQEAFELKKRTTMSEHISATFDNK